MPSPLETLLPPIMTADPQLTAAELPRTVLMRVNFIPGVRQRLGWRGVKECSGRSGALTLKIADLPGVFGISPVRSEDHDGQGRAEFNLCYFPAPAEELLETFSVAAGIAALRDDYLDRVREFVGDEQFLTLFRLASLQVSYHGQTEAIALSLVAAERQRLLSAEGVIISTPGGEEQVVTAGGIDQDSAAFEITLPFFRALAASFSFSLAAAPNALQLRSRPGKQLIYFQNNRFESKTTHDSKQLNLSLVWGEQRGLTAGREFPQLEVDWRDPDEKPLEYRDEPWWQSQVPGARFSIDKNSMGITERPKLIVLTGFLGAGKTSFLNHFVEYQASKNAFVAIIQNEIGAQGLDSRLLGQHYAVTEMDEGCVCCTLSGNLKLALAEILSGFQPDFVVVETTGLANPANFLSEISELEDQLDFCSITTMVDASQGQRPIDKFTVAREQLMLADAIILNKTDQASSGQIAELTERIQTLNPVASIHNTSFGDCSPAQIYGVNFTNHVRLPDLAIPSGISGGNHQDQGVASLTVNFKEPLNRQDFLNAASKFSTGILRVKGILQFTDNSESLVYQYVPGLQSLTPIVEKEQGNHFLVFIGEKIHCSVKPFIKQFNL